MKKETFNNFCEKILDRMYEPRLPYESQSTGYKQLRKMVEENITPASLADIERWEKSPTTEELFVPPDIKYLRFLHPKVRPFVVQNWDKIKNLEL